MFHFLIQVMIITQGSPITDLIEGTSPSNVDWQKQDTTPFNEKFSCDNGQLIGPFIGKIDMNIKKTFTNLQPHYSLQITLDLLFTEYWSGNSNYVNILIDSQTIYSDSSISTTNFNTPSNYCKTNAFLIFVYNQQLITLRQSINHQNLNPTLEIKSSFQCTLLSLYTVCEKLLVKNVVITPQLCHFTCLTCTGPNENDCLTCPNGTIQNGKCDCQNGYSSYNYQCVQSCPPNYISQNKKCQLNCSLNCQQCLQKKCKVCENGYLLYKGTCVQTCPKSSSLQNNICVDYQEQSTFGSEYIGQYFDSLDIDLLNQINKFTFTLNPSLSKLTGQIFSTYNNQYLLGGFGVWSNGFYNTVFNGLPGHNYIRIYLTAWFIDNWTNEQFIIKLDNQIVNQISYQSQKAISNLFYRSSYDYVEDIYLKLVHTSNSAQLTFQTTLSISAYEASLALSNIYILIDYCDDNCEICSPTQCNTCKNPYQLIHNKCALCDSTNFRNNDCSCQIGFYDDNINLQCQTCKQECESCLDGNSCTQCKLGTNLIILPNCMNCNTGFYYNNGICSQCDKSCLTCYGSQQSQCSSCLEDYILNSNDQCQICQNNQFIQNNTCQDCNYNCETCIEELKCLTCAQGRINAPQCICDVGYYEGNDKKCQQCGYQCSTCKTSRDNCLTCSGNRQLPPLCNCSGDSEQNTSSIWCTDCSIVNLDLKMSANVKKLIINFGKKIQKINSECSAIFEQTTLQYLGVNPICYINQFSISINLGQNASVYFGLSVNFKPNIIKFQECQNSVSQFFNNILLISSDLEPPLILFTKNSIILSGCSDNQDEIYEIQNYNFGSSPITLVDWKLVRATQQDPKINDLLDNLKIQFNHQNQSQNVNFQFLNGILEIPNEVLLELKYKNFLGIFGSSFITIKQLTTTIFINVQTQRSQYVSSQLMSISIKVSHCSDVLTNNIKLNLSTKIGTLQKEIQIYFDEYYLYQIEPYLLNPGLYQFNIEVNYQENLVIEDKLQILIVNEESILKLITQSNYLSYSQQLEIQGQVTNLAQQNPLLQWDCFDITQNQECKTLNQSLLILPNSQNLTLQPFTLTPFSVYMFTAIFQDLQQSIIMTIVETDVPKIEYKSNPDITNGYINFYDQLLFQFKYLEIVQNPDYLLYTGILSTSDLIIKHFKFDYLDLQISLWHYFDVDQLTKNINLKINIYNPDYFLPSQVTIPLKINIPPQHCIINIDQLYTTTIQNDYQIKITNCMDENFPLQYRLILYLNSSDLNFDYQINKVQKGIILNEYQYNNFFQTKLTGNGTIQLLVQVKDSLNGISNFTNSQYFQYKQGVLGQILTDKKSISQTLIYVASLQFEQKLNFEEVKKTLLQEIIYFSNCECITEKQLLSLKSLSVNYKSWSVNNINTEISLQKDRLNSINLQMANQYLIEYDKFEHTVQEFKKLILLEETLEMAKYINELYKINRDNQLLTRRLISEQDFEGKNNNNYIIMDSINLITEIQLSNQIINGNLQTIVTNSFNISTQKATQKVLQNLISSSLIEPQIIGQEEQNNNQSELLETYSYKMINYKKNPYKFDTYFIDLNVDQNDYPLYQPEIKQMSNSILVQNISSSQGIRYNFENQDQNHIVECVSKVEDSWSLDACQTIQEGKKTICHCQYVSSTTILQATQQIFNQAVDFFSLDTIHKMINCEYQSILFTYIVMTYTILFFWFIFYGFRMDQSKNEDLLFYSTKVAPTDWDLITEKAGAIINVGEIESEKKINTIDRTGIRKETQKKTIFSSNDSQITSDDKQFKRPHFEYYNKMLASKKSIGITTNVCSGRIIEENEAEVSPKSKTANSPNVKIANSETQSSHRMKQVVDDESLYKKYSTQKLSLCKAILLYTELNHKVLSLYYLYDKDCSRVYRTIMLYVSLLGEISILTFFGKIINLNTIIALSILQTLFGVIYKKLLQVFLRSEKLCLNYLGFNLAILSVLFFLFIIFGSVAKYKSVLEASLWGAAYISSFILDYLIYTNIQILLFFTIIVKFGNSQIVKKYLKIFLNDKVFVQTFGNS